MLRKLPHLILFAIIFLMSAGSVLSQQGNNWYFGHKAGISFKTSPPTVLPDGQLFTDEGCASISDNTGNLLFYTDGVTVYNRLHQVMPNGTDLMGHISSSNSAIILKKPGSAYIYYIITADAGDNYGKYGYRYSEVDIRLDGNLGDVTVKNIELYAASSERLTATQHANGVDFWIVTKAAEADIFKVFKVTCGGIDLNPVESRLGIPNWPSSNGDLVGCMKVSPDGKKVSLARTQDEGWELFKFDNSTGILSDAIFIPHLYRTYGVEFSPDSKLLYVATECCSSHGTVHQYKIDTHDSTIIQSSKYTVDSSQHYKTAMQIGPDGKIYGSNSHDSSLNVINNPDVYGAGCNYRYRAISWLGRPSKRGLPVFYANAVLNQNADFSFSINPDCRTVTFTATTKISNPSLWKWDFGDGTTATGQIVTHAFPATGDNYNVVLSVENSDVCKAEATRFKTVSLNRIVPDTKFDFKAVCGNMTVLFGDSSTVTNGLIDYWHWDFGDGTTSTQQHPSHAYTALGDYNVRFISGNTSGCGLYDTLFKKVSIEPKPQAAFTNTKTCLNQLVRFIDNTTIAAGSTTEWYWSLGDGNQNSTKNPTHTYAGTGDFLVKFVAKSSTGCLSDTISKMVSVTNVPSASFTTTNACFNRLTQFKGQAQITGGNISNWWWDMGNSTIANIQNPQLTYGAPGIYKIKFAATANSGCASDTLEKEILIGNTPSADFSFVTNCGNKEVRFKDLSSNLLQPVSQWSWQFGDAVTANAQHPNHSYPSYNDYEVKFVAISSVGCASDTVVKKIEVNAKPLADFSLINGCVNTPVTFENKSTIEAGSISTYSWKLGGIKESDQQNPTHSFVDFGNYQIKFAVSSSRGCVSDTVARLLSIEPKPSIDFTIVDGCTGKPVTIQPTASIGFGSIEKHQWNFGNGETSALANPVYNYPSHGTYPIQYIATSKNGCASDPLVKNILIQSNPIANSSFGNTCAGKEVLFNNTSSNSLGEIVTWNWNFGNGNTSAGFEPTQTYSTFGQFPVRLTASTVNGCSGSSEKLISISKVIINAGRDTIAAIGQPVQLLATGAASYSWSPALYLDNSLSNKPISTPQNNITYFVSGTTTEGCLGFDTINIKVFKGPAIYVPNAFTPQGANPHLKPILAGIDQLEYFKVYNRWGEMIFSTSNRQLGWDGKLKGIEQPSGIYIWMLRAKDYLGRWHNEKGTALLIR